MSLTAHCQYGSDAQRGVQLTVTMPGGGCVLGEESKIGEVFFVPSCYAPKASNVRHVEHSREETLHLLCRGHLNTRSARRELLGIAFLPSPNN